MLDFSLIVVRASDKELTFAKVTGRMTDAVASTIQNDLHQEVYIRKAICAALTKWVIDTDEGRAWYDATAEDANIGDVDALGQLPELVRRELYEQSGILDLRIECVCHDDCCQDWLYDTLLVDSGKVEESEYDNPP